MDDPISFLFILLWIFVLGLILYSAFKSCFASRSRTNSNSRPTPRPVPRTPGSSWFSGGGGGGPRPDHHDAPPPYTKYPSSSLTGAADAGGWRPGFWSGATLGYLGSQFMNRQNQQQQQQQQGQPFVRPQVVYDWEAPGRSSWSARRAPQTSSSWFGGPGSGASRRPMFGDDDRGEGSSNLGGMRRSTGLGGTNVR